MSRCSAASRVSRFRAFSKRIETASHHVGGVGPRAKRAPVTSRKSKTALVVATTYLIASAIESPLKKSGFRVVVARDDEKALEALASQNVHLAIIDFRLQHRQPDGLAAHLEACSIPYIFCTAASPEEVAKHFPVASVIEQPFRDDQLLRVVSELVGR